MTEQHLIQTFFNVRHAEPDARRRGKGVISLAAVLIALCALICVFSLFAAEWRSVALAMLPVMTVCGLAIYFAQAGRVLLAAQLLLGVTLAALVMAPVLSQRVAFTPFFFLIPILLAFITLPASAMWTASVATLGALGLLAFLTNDLPVVEATKMSIYLLSGMLIAIFTVVGYVGIGTTQRALDATSYAQRQTEQIATVLQREKDSLAQRVEERTADLSTALAEARRLADEQSRLLAENAEQRAVIRNLSVPVLPLDRGLLVIPVIGALDSDRLADLRRQALQAVQAHAARRLLLDLTGVAVVDEEIARALLETMDAARLLGTAVALVGIRPEVAQSLVALNLDTGMFQTFSDLQQALRHSRQRA